ncbi:hypothetical protein [Reichenbachiella sp.]|uniref:hypothetical protein n=1 Tax=Reichenbachiella sp. TaxID=2184521 RepID=UPI003298E773
MMEGIGINCQPKQPYTLPSRSKTNHTCQNLSKSMSAERTVVNRNGLREKENSTGIQQGLRKHRGSVVFGSSELFDSPPTQNFDNEKSKLNYKNIWLG